MAKFLFPFTKRRLEDGTYIKEPKIPVSFIGKEGPIDAVVVLDTGSTISYLPLEFAELLGFEKNKARKIETEGIGGKEEIGEFEVNLKITRKGREARINNMPIYVFMDPKVKFSILGLEPFFEKFQIHFKLLENKIELNEAQARRAK